MSVLAADGKGDVVFRGRVPDAGANSTPSPAPGAAPSGALPSQRLVFDAPPGELELRLSVEEATGGVLDSEIRRIQIPDLTTPDAGVSTPRVYRTRTAREFQTLAADAAAVPTAGREFSRTERLLIRFDVYGNATPTAVLLNRSGQKMADLPIASATAGGTHQMDVGLSSIPGGEYLVEITLKGATSETKELVPFRIGA